MVLVKSNKWSIINAVFWLVELLLGYMLYPTRSEKRELFDGKKGLKSSFNYLKFFILDIFNPLLDFTKTIIPLSLMASESIAHSALGLMGYLLRDYSGPRNNC